MCEEFENGKKKEQKNFDLLEWGFEPQIFSNFPTHGLNFHSRRSPISNQNKLLKEIGLYLPKAINGFDGQGHSGSHGSNNKNSNTHDPEYFSFGSIRPEDQFVNISGKHGRC